MRWEFRKLSVAPEIWTWRCYDGDELVSSSQVLFYGLADVIADARRHGMDGESSYEFETVDVSGSP